jgi:hypothetical protein
MVWSIGDTLAGLFASLAVVTAVQGAITYHQLWQLEQGAVRGSAEGIETPDQLAWLRQRPAAGGPLGGVTALGEGRPRLQCSTARPLRGNAAEHAMISRPARWTGPTKDP